MAKNALGKGLDALLHSAETEVAAPEESRNFLFVPVEKLKANPFQPRKEFDEAGIEELAQSIRENGIVTPITVERGENGEFFIIAGERRTRAARILGLSEIPAYVREMDDLHKLRAALIENIQRENLNPVEEAQAYQRLLEMSGANQEEVAKIVGKNRATVANSIRLLKLSGEMQDALRDGRISAGHARAILSVESETDRRILFGKIIGSQISVREAESAAAELNGKNPNSKKKPRKAESPSRRDADFEKIESEFIEALGTKVALKGDFSKGTVEIEYFSKDDLTAIYEKIVGRKGEQSR